MEYRVAHHVGIDVEIYVQQVHEWVDVRQPEVGDEIGVLGGSWRSVERTRERSTNEVVDSQSVQNPREPRDDERRLGLH